MITIFLFGMCTILLFVLRNRLTKKARAYLLGTMKNRGKCEESVGLFAAPRQRILANCPKLNEHVRPDLVISCVDTRVARQTRARIVRLKTRWLSRFGHLRTAVKMMSRAY